MFRHLINNLQELQCATERRNYHQNNIFLFINCSNMYTVAVKFVSFGCLQFGILFLCRPHRGFVLEVLTVCNRRRDCFNFPLVVGAASERGGVCYSRTWISGRIVAANIISYVYNDAGNENG
jgi:hypothetical protein